MANGGGYIRGLHYEMYSCAACGSQYHEGSADEEMVSSDILDNVLVCRLENEPSCLPFMREQEERWVRTH